MHTVFFQLQEVEELGIDTLVAVLIKAPEISGIAVCFRNRRSNKHMSPLHYITTCFLF
jgi:hypothetical protein